MVGLVQLVSMVVVVVWLKILLEQLEFALLGFVYLLELVPLVVVHLVLVVASLVDHLVLEHPGSLEVDYLAHFVHLVLVVVSFVDHLALEPRGSLEVDYLAHFVLVVVSLVPVHLVALGVLVCYQLVKWLWLVSLKKLGALVVFQNLLVSLMVYLVLVCLHLLQVLGPLVYLDFLVHHLVLVWFDLQVSLVFEVFLVVGFLLEIAQVGLVWTLVSLVDLWVLVSFRVDLLILLVDLWFSLGVDLSLVSLYLLVDQKGSFV